ncbi:kinase-like domain-containing protein [Rhizophagus clarus]|uniref:Kinase-like domain-containing protein n=1 Tax=Rhizophagus clarus TaxID=94130 RepID=A0A8H3R542_9GLOM|nr:kinase-like domain-containing protein [Rhizophagus clarus]
MVLRYIYGGRLSLEEYDTSDIIRILVASNELIWEQVLKWGIAQNPELPSDPSSYSKNDFITLKNTLQQLIPFINFFNLTSKEYLDKVYPYKKIIPKDLRENLFKHFMDQPNNNSEPKTTKEIDSIATSSKQENLPAEEAFNIIVDEIDNFIYKLLNKGIDRKSEKQKVIEYFNDYNINSQEIYNWLLNNRISRNSIFLFGYFNYHGIVANENYDEALSLFICALAQEHNKLAQYFIGECYRFGLGITRMKN